MREKTILSIGALTLATGLGLAAMTAANMLTLPFAAAAVADEAPTYLSWTATPANNANLINWQDNSIIDLGFTNANPGTFPGVTINRKLETPIKIYKNHSGVMDVVKEILPSSTAEVTEKPRYETNVLINVGDVFKTQGSYLVEIPAGLVSTTSSGTGMTDPSGSGETAASEISPYITLTYRVMAAAQYEVSLKPGQTVSTGGLNTYTITFEGATGLAVNPDAGKPILEYCNPANTVVYDRDENGNIKEDANGDPIVIEGADGSHVAIGAYSATVEGNVATMTLSLYPGEETQPTTDVTSYQIVVPAGYFTVESDGQQMSSLEIKVDNLKQVWFNSDEVKIIGYDDTEVEGPEDLVFTPATFPSVFYLELPFEMARNSTNPNSTFNVLLYQEVPGAAPQATSITGKGLLEANGTMVSVTFTYTGVNIPANLFTGKYMLQVYAKSLKDPNDGSLTNPTFYVPGITLEDANTTIPVVGSNFAHIKDGAAGSASTKSFSAGFESLSVEEGINAFRMKFKKSMDLTGDATKKIALYRKGVAEPIWEQTADQALNTSASHLWVGTGCPTSSTKTVKGTDWMITYSNTELVGTKYVLENYPAGSYEIRIDGGFFKSTVFPLDWLNKDQVVEFAIVTPLVPEVSPATESETTSIQDITFTYPEGAVVTLKDPMPEIKLVTGPTEVKNVIPEGLEVFTAKAEGNVVTLSLAGPMTAVYKNFFKVAVPAAAWSIAYNGETQTNQSVELKYYQTKLLPGEMSPAPTAEGETIPCADLQNLTYISRQLVRECSTSEASMIGLYDAEGNVVTTYTVTNAPKEDSTTGASGAPITELKLAADKDIASIPSGEYEVRIPVDALTYLNATATEVFTYKYNVKGVDLPQNGELSDYITLNIPSSLDANPLNTKTPYGSTAMGIISLGLKTELTPVADCDKIKYYYKADETSEPELLTELDPNNGMQVAIMGAVGGDDSGLLEFDPVTFMYLLLANDGQGGVDMNAVKTTYSRTGFYVLDIPNNAFKAGDVQLNGIQLTYYFDNTEVPVDFVYTLTPADGSQISDAAATFGSQGTGITLEFPNASLVDSFSAAGKMTFPDGNTVTSTPGWTKNMKGLIFCFGGKNTDWSKDGQYVFEIPEGKVLVDMGWVYDLDYGEKGNFPGLKATYIVSESVGVGLIGLDKADSYNVYTLDGCAVKLNAAPAEMVDLAPGLYIINGQKVKVVK